MKLFKNNIKFTHDTIFNQIKETHADRYTPNLNNILGTELHTPIGQLTNRLRVFMIVNQTHPEKHMRPIIYEPN